MVWYRPKCHGAISRDPRDHLSLGCNTSRTQSEEGEREHGHQTRSGQYDRRTVGSLPPSAPNEGVGGLMPTPMKDSAASVKIVSGMPKAIETTIEVSGARQDVAGHHPPASGGGERGR